MLECFAFLARSVLSLRFLSRHIPPVHPGAVLADDIKARGLTAHALALELHVPANRLSDILSGKRAITAETALRLGRHLGTGSALWLNMQAQYDLAVAEPDHGAQIAQEVTVAVAATALKRADWAKAETTAAAETNEGAEICHVLRQAGAAEARLRHGTGRPSSEGIETGRHRSSEKASVDRRVKQ
jgi:antitoxin HigA-1